MIKRAGVAILVLCLAQGFALRAATPGLAAPKPAPNPKFAHLPDNTVVDLGPLKLEVPEGEGQGSGAGVTDYSGMTYDPHNHRVLMFGGGHATTFSDTIYVFDFKTLEWSSLYKPTPARFYKPENMEKAFWKAGGEGPYPRPVARHTYDLLLVPDHRKEFLVLMNGCGPSSVAPGIGYFGGGGGAYDFATGKWERFESAFGGYGAVAEYDPVSKKVIGQAGQGVFVLDLETRKSAKILDNIIDKHKVTAYSGTLVYYPPDQCMYGIGDKKEPWKLELNRQDFAQSKITKLTATGDRPQPSECAFAYDPKSKLIGGGIMDGKFYTFDPAKSVWAAHAMQGDPCTHMTFHCLAYNPVDNVHLFIGTDPQNRYGKRTFAYRFKN